MFKQISECRICGSKNLSIYLDLGSMPLANALLRPETKEKPEHFFPLETMFCNDCSLSQLSVVVDPNILFSGYAYRSSISKTFRQHCRDMGVEIKKRLGGKNGLLALDIASNDGCLLKEFRSEGFKVVGVEPATNLAAIARADAITTFDSFWSAKTAENIVKELGKVDVITATNVLAHVDDVNAFVSALDIVLNENGLVVIEVPTVANIVEKNQFDTIYHEHLSYFLLKPLMTLFERNGFNVIDIQQFEIHGGSMRIFAAKKSSSLKKNEITINQYIEMEELKQLYSLQTYLKLARNVEKIKKELLSILTEINEGGKHVAAYGASAKGNTLLNYCGIGTNLISFIIDDTPEKQNCLAPGNHIPILPYVHLEEKKPQYLVLLAWNFARELISKTSVHRNRGGKYIIPIPEVKIVSSENEL